VRLHAPIPRPGKIMAIGMNYADHVKEMGREPPQHQVWFAKATTAVNGPYDPIQIPKVSDAVDWEAELVVVIGKRGRHIAKEQARDHIFGYCCGNDVSARDWQNRTPQWILGKSFDTHAPFGPWITTADEVGDPHTLGIRCLVNGETRQNSNTANLVFNVWDQIAHLSQVMTLEPGDLIYTGTPGGVGMGMKLPVFLKPGDRVRVEIDKLGALDALCEAER
jgi:2-keto-4-pentenoate hydratase/2-oxohepta-3-ene-1,7-dioic acid hydratase in catechol pathway